MLRLLNFEKKYGQDRIVAVASMTFEAGVHWVRGANGSGKSTLFKALAGLIPCTGTISFDDDIALHDHPVEYRRRVNFAEAEPVYPGFLTGKEVFTFAAHAKSATSTQQREIIERFGLAEFLRQQCSTYSSGMAKRLSLAIAFLGTPRVIILDEPLITLDTAIRDTLITLIKQIIPEERKVFLISSHELLTEAHVPIVRSLVIHDHTLKPA
jgi:ABC-2 type transport system ATP-binding protein